MSTLYTLIFKNNKLGDYDVYERHTCQEPGCTKTDEEYLTVCLPGKIEEFIEDFQNNRIEDIVVEGTVDEVIVDHYIMER